MTSRLYHTPLALCHAVERALQRLARRAQADPYFRSELAARPAAQECLRRRSRPAAMDARGAAGANQ